MSIQPSHNIKAVAMKDQPVRLVAKSRLIFKLSGDVRTT